MLIFDKNIKYKNMNISTLSFARRINIFIFLVLLTFSANNAAAKEIFVDASNLTGLEDGSIASPFRTISQATTVAVAGDVVTIRAGVYREEVLIPADKITFQAYQNEEVIINGTEIVTGWTQVNSTEVYKSLMNWDYMPEEGSNQVFVDQNMINLTRWPDQTSADIVKPSDAIAESVTASVNLVTIKDTKFDEPDGRWIGAQIWVNLSHNGADGQGWTGIITATSQANHTVTFDFRGTPNLGDKPWGMGKNTEYYLFNPTISGVDATGGVTALLSKGEWWKKGDTLFVHTPDGNAPGEIAALQNVVEARKRNLAFSSSDPQVNRSYTIIRNFTLFAATITTDNNYNARRKEIVEDAQGILIEGIKAKYLTHFTNQTGNWQDQWTGRSGIILSGIGNTMRNCTLQYSAGPGVCIMGYGNKLLNCTVTGANYSNSNSGAVNCGYLCIDGEIAYNTIDNTPMIALHFNGLVNSNPQIPAVARIHHNIIRDFMRRGYDSGAMDQVGHDGQWLRIDHNLIYNTLPDAIAGPSRYGVYLDFGGGTDGFAGKYIVDHNVIHHVYVPVLINHINDAWIYNNTGVYVGDPNYAIVNGNGGTGKTDIIRNNIFGGISNDDSWGSLKDAVKENNILNAKGSALADIFADPANFNFKLKPSAATAIDIGLDFSPYNEPLNGPPDLGAYEYGTSNWVAGPSDFLAPVISPNGGYFVGSIEVSLQNLGTSGTIHYTLDGSDPTISSPEYLAPFTVSDTAIVKARCFISENEYTEVAAANFYVETLNLPLRDPENPIDIQQGINYAYYDWWAGLGLEKLPDLETWTPTRTGVASTIDLTPAHEPDNFAFRFTGYIEVPVDGVYTFYTTSDDNSKLYIGSTLVVNNDYMQAPTERKGRIGLKAGKHSITVEFMEVGGGEALSASYKGPTISKRFLPASSLWHKEYIAQTAKVLITPHGGKYAESVTVNMSCSTPGSQIFYTTDGSTPTVASTPFTQDIILTTYSFYKAVAYSASMPIPLSVIDSVVFMPSTAPVTISPIGGSFVESATVTLSTITPGATIVYTVDGSDPKVTSIQYSAPFIVDSSILLKTLAFKDGLAESYIDSASFIIKVSPPVFLPASSTFSNTVMVSISCITPGAKIYYAINGTPTESSTLYTAPFEINATCFIKAFAIKSGLTSSTMVKKGLTLVTGIEDIKSDELVVYPNPSDNGIFKIQLPECMQNKKVLLQITDLLGQTVYTEVIPGTNNSVITNSKPLKQGCYFLLINAGSTRITTKLIVK
jgi:hypothetical protein